MEYNEQSIAQAIEDAAVGSQIAYSFLLDHFWPLVYGYQLKRIQNEVEAEDITIQTFARAFASLQTYRREYEFGTWLVTISKNIQIDLYRKKKNNILSQATNSMEMESDAERVLDESPTAEDRLISDQNLATLQRYLKELKPKYQRVLQMRYFNELGYNEMAELLGEPVGTVKVKVLRARRLLAGKIREASS